MFRFQEIRPLFSIFIILISIASFSKFKVKVQFKDNDKINQPRNLTSTAIGYSFFFFIRIDLKFLKIFI